MRIFSFPTGASAGNITAYYCFQQGTWYIIVCNADTWGKTTLRREQQRRKSEGRHDGTVRQGPRGTAGERMRSWEQLPGLRTARCVTAGAAPMTENTEDVAMSQWSSCWHCDVNKPRGETTGLQGKATSSVWATFDMSTRRCCGDHRWGRWTHTWILTVWFGRRLSFQQRGGATYTR